MKELNKFPLNIQFFTEGGDGGQGGAEETISKAVYDKKVNELNTKLKDANQKLQDRLTEDEKRAEEQKKKDKELEELCIKVEEALKELGKPVTVSELMKESTHEVATLSNQKLSALLKKCVEVRKTVDKTVDKKKSYFSIKEEV